jgi:hypothetical protein
MWRSLAVILVSVGLVLPAVAEQSRTKSATMFCSRRDDLLMYAIAKNTKEFKNRDVTGCSMLRKGQRYTVLDSGEGSIVRIRVHLPGRGTVEGYAANPGE